MTEESGGLAEMQLAVMDHSETLKHEEWKVSRELAEEMIRDIPGLCDKFQLDQITMGNGECFHTAVHQQLRRPDVQNNLSQRNKQLSRNSDMKAFKSTVRRFMLKNNHPKIASMKEGFQNFMEGMTWEEYWSPKNLLRKEFWADEVFIRATAWFLKLDIVMHQNILGCPEKLISGNIDDDTSSSEGPKLHLGYLLSRHFQSLIPRVQPLVEEDEDACTSQESMLTDQAASICPYCKKSFKKVLKHFQTAKTCMNKVTEEEIEYFKKISNDRARENRKRRRETDDPEKVRHDNKKRKEAQKLRDSEKVKDKEKKWRADQKEKNAEKVKEQNRKRKAAQRERDREKMREDHKRYVERHRIIQNEEDRLKKFLQNTLYGAVFICLSCHQRHFQSNVTVFSEVKKTIKMPLEDCIVEMDPLKNTNFGEVIFSKKGENSQTKNNQFLCKTCLGYLKKNKLPPHSVMNGLKLDATDADIEKDGLAMTELENSLIASRIIFQKIFLLPSSRWSGLKDKQVNIPISSSKINDTLEKLPRTPTSAGLIGVQLKRKLEYKNVHKYQLINPQKLFLFIDKAKEMGNPYYKDISTFDTYKQKCRNLDKDGFNLVFGEDEDGADNVDQDPQQEDKLTDEILLEEYEKNDPVKKYQFHYDDSIVMTDKFPEISVAPGENEIPRSVLFDDNWDVRAFPALHNYDGSNGKDQE